MNVVSFLNPKEVEQLGEIPSKAVCGYFENESTDPRHFVENKEFVQYMHTIIAEKGFNLPSLKDAAKQRINGYLYIIDLRTPEGIMGNVPPEDIIGAFKVENQQLVNNSYWRNGSHKILTENGLVKLPLDMCNLVIEDLKK
jgi:hypothetical protein